MSRIVAVTESPARGHRAGQSPSRRRWTPIALAGVVVVAAVTAAVLAFPAHQARPAPAVPPLVTRIAAFTPPRTPVNPGGTLVPSFVGKDRNAVVSIAFSPDGKTLATSGTNGSAYLWRIG
jgi:WD40 repeat protein